MTPPNLQLTPKQEEALIHYAKQRMARHRSHLDKRPPLWLQLIATAARPHRADPSSIEHPTSSL